MAFAIYLHRDNFQPEAPLILDKNTTDANVNFTAVDFVPSVIKRPTTIIPQCVVEYHSFSTIIQVANGWLQKNGHIWEVVNCETIIILYKYNDSPSCYEMRPDDCCFYIYGSEKNNVLKALRMWVRRRIPPAVNKRTTNEDDTAYQVLNFRDIIPEIRKNCPESGFEDLDDIIARYNYEIKSNPLDGKIITIESLAYEANKDWKIDTDTSLSTLSTKNIFILRIFYDLGDYTADEIDIRDFSPTQIRRATFFKRPTFETFDKVIERASSWLQKHPECRFVNAQSIDVKMKSMRLVNSRQMAFTEHGDYMRIFRIACLKLSHDQVDPHFRVILSTRMFLPHKKVDTITDIKQRLSDWVNQFLDKYQNKTKSFGKLSKDGAKTTLPNNYPEILSAETVEVFAKDFRHDSTVGIEKAANDDTFLANRFGNKNAYMFFSLRIFYDSSSLSSGTKIVSTDSVNNTPNITKRNNYQK